MVTLNTLAYWRPFVRVTRQALSLVVVFILTIGAVALSAPSARAQADGWVQLETDADGPSQRWDHTLGADEAGSQLVLFGGRDAGGAAMGDTWLFDLEEETWSPLEGSAPEPRFGHAIAVDQEARRLYLFGGQADGTTFFNDAWVLDLDKQRWSLIEPAGDERPSTRYGTSAVLDGDGHLLISHGFTDQGRFDDTWSLDFKTKTWTDVSPDADGERPLKRCLHEAIWDTDTGRMLLYGGCSSGFGPCPQGDLWAFDPEARAWKLLAEDGPAARSNPALAVDPANGRAILIDGLTESGFTADTWTLPLGDDQTWQETAVDGPLPAARSSHDTAVVSTALYLFGGLSDEGPLADLWQLDLESN